jgi:hypothetical protein
MSDYQLIKKALVCQNCRSKRVWLSRGTLRTEYWFLWPTALASLAIWMAVTWNINWHNCTCFVC